MKQSFRPFNVTTLLAAHKQQQFCCKEIETMDQIHDHSNGRLESIKENGFHLYPVSINDSGEGLPYAPINWPNNGDKWSWKVGKRVANSGYFLDRYLYLPRSLQKGGRKRSGFASKLSVEQYIRSAFPGTDVNAVFASFSWKIPAKKSYEGNEEELKFITVPSTDNIAEPSGLNSQSSDEVCKAGNRTCSSLTQQSNIPTTKPMSCDICCDEPGFCRDCCCILCCKTVSSGYGGYSFIKCQGTGVEGFVCGHVAHVVCGLRSYLAGTVGGSIGLDAEYQCRRCDWRMDMVPHVEKILRSCETVDCPNIVERILNLGACVLRGTQKSSAKRLLDRIELVIAKIKNKTYTKDVWEVKGISAVKTGGASRNGNDDEEPMDCKICSSFGPWNLDHKSASIKLQGEIHRILEKLRMSQETEYEIVEQKLHAQKDYILGLYQHFDNERSKLNQTSSSDSDSLLDSLLETLDRIKRETAKLKEMGKVADGLSILVYDQTEHH